MRRVIVIALMAFAVCCEAANFTDVTVAGTPYLTTNITHELNTAFIERLATASDFPSSGWTNALVGAGAMANRIPLSVDTSLSPERGLLDLVKHIRRFTMTTYWSSVSLNGWIAEIPSTITTVSNVPTAFEYANAGEFLVALGLSNGWRSATSYDPTTNDWRDLSDTMYTAGTNTASVMSLGEIMGPWIIDDCQIAIDGLRYYAQATGQTPTPSWEAGSVTNNRGGGDASGATWTLAKSGAETDYAYFTQDGAPYMITRGYVSGANWQAFAESRSTSLNFGVMTDSNISDLGGTVHIGALAEVSDSSSFIPTFDANSTGLVEDQWTIFDTVTVTAGNTNDIISDALGDADIANWCDEPQSTNTASLQLWQGWVLYNAELSIVEPTYTITKAP